MKVLFFGDSITDALRNRELLYGEESLGYGYVKQVAAQLGIYTIKNYLANEWRITAERLYL